MDGILERRANLESFPENKASGPRFGPGCADVTDADFKLAVMVGRSAELGPKVTNASENKVKQLGKFPVSFESDCGLKGIAVFNLTGKRVGGFAGSGAETYSVSRTHRGQALLIRVQTAKGLGWYKPAVM